LAWGLEADWHVVRFLAYLQHLISRAGRGSWSWTGLVIRALELFHRFEIEEGSSDNRLAVAGFA
jgi:hypothetical protein